MPVCGFLNHFINLVATFSGLIADSRTLVERAQMECQNYWFVYNRQMRVEDVTQSVANLTLQFGDDDAKVGLKFWRFTKFVYANNL
jgi:20S proteasome alpha/beta subunit